MGRGPLLKTLVRKEKALTKARIQAEFKEKNRLKNSEKGYMVSLREHIGKALDRIDPLEGLATISMTVLVHETILHDPEILRQIQNVFSTVSTAIANPLYAYLGGLAGYFGLGFLFPPVGYQETRAPGPWDPVLLWAISFAIAFIICRFSGQIVQGIGQAVGGLSSMVKLLLPVVAAA
jgi:hypothetical protein